MISRVLGDASQATLSTVIRSVGRIIALIVLARVADVNTVAIYTVMTAIEQAVISAANALCSSPAVVLSAGRRNNLRLAALLSAERLQLWGSIPLVVMAVAGCAAWGYAPDAAALAFGAVLLSGVAYQARRSSLVALFRSTRVLIAEVLIAVFVVAGPVIAYVLNFDPLLALWFGLGFVQLTVIAWLPIGVVRMSPWVRRILRRAILQTGWRMLAGSLAVSASGRSQSLILSAFVTPGVVAMYGIANSFAAPVRLVGGAVRAPLLPRITLCNEASIAAVVRPKWIVGTIALITAGSLCAHITAPVCIELVYGARYSDAGALVGPLVAWALTWCVGSLLVVAHQAAGRSGWCAAVRWCGAAVAVVGMLIGGATLGVTGIVWAAALSEVAVVVVFVLRLRTRITRVRSQAIVVASV